MISGKELVAQKEPLQTTINKQLKQVYSDFLKLMLLPVLAIGQVYVVFIELYSVIELKYVLAGISILVLVNAFVIARFDSAENAGKDLSAWGKYGVSICFVNGLIFALFYAYTAYQLGAASFVPLSLMSTGIVALASLIMKSSSKLLFALILPLVVSISVVFVISGSHEAYILSASLVLLTLVGVWSSHRSTVAIKHSIQQNQHNDELIYLLRKTETKLTGLTVNDEITNLYTKQYFLSIYTAEYRRAKRVSYPLTIMIAEIDGYSDYLDAFGHSQAQKTLGQFGGIIRNLMKRGGEIAAVYGPGTFAFVLPNVNTSDAEKFANKIQKSILNARIQRAAVKVVGPQYLSISVGIAEFSDEKPCSKEQLIKNTEAALKEAQLKEAKVKRTPDNWFTFGINKR